MSIWRMDRSRLRVDRPNIEFSDLSLSQDVRKSVFGRFPWKCWFYTTNETHKQYSLLDTIFSYIFHFGPPGKHLYLSHPNLLHVGRQSRPTCRRFPWLFYRCFGGPKLKYSQILYLIDYIAYGLHFRKPISLHPGLATSLLVSLLACHSLCWNARTSGGVGLAGLPRSLLNCFDFTTTATLCYDFADLSLSQDVRK